MNQNIPVADCSFSFISHLECPACRARYEIDLVQTVCRADGCGSTLYTRYNLPSGLSANKLLEGRPANMWRYHEFLPVQQEKYVANLGEGFTPILPMKHLSRLTDGLSVIWKDESRNPTGSFKARGLGMAVSKAKELGITHIATATAGNAGGALAAYCASMGIYAHVYMPIQTPSVFKNECKLYGAEVVEIDGNIADCGKRAETDAQDKGWFLVSTLKEPYRLEGKKTMGYEIAEQLGWKLPDVILYPTGGGTGLLGIWKAFDELEQLGWIDGRRPNMVAVQSESCKGIVEAFHNGSETAAYQDNGFTIANGLRVPKPYADRLILQVLRQSNGTAIAIADNDMEQALKEIAANEGLLFAPEGAALWAAFKQLYASRWFSEGQTVLLLNTGSGYKYLENLTI